MIMWSIEYGTVTSAAVFFLVDDIWYQPMYWVKSIVSFIVI